MPDSTPDASFPFSLLEASREFLSFLKAWESDAGFRVAGAPGSSPSFLLARAFLSSPRPTVVVARDEAKGERWRRELEGCLGRPVELYPALEVLPDDEVKPNPEMVGERYRILRLLREASDPVLVAPLSAALQPCPPPARFESDILFLRSGHPLGLSALVTRLVRAGYEHANPVLVKGQFGRRGGIVDVFPGHADRPLRLEFEGETLSSLRTFDPQSQASVSVIERAELYPVKLPGPGRHDESPPQNVNGFSPDLVGGPPPARSDRGEDPSIPSGQAAAPTIKSDRGRPSHEFKLARLANLFDYLPCRSRLVLMEEVGREEIDSLGLRTKKNPLLLFGALDQPLFERELPLAADFSIHALEKYKYRPSGGVHPLLEAVPEWLEEGYRCLIFAHNQGEARRLKEILRERGVSVHPRLHFSFGEMEQGFLWEERRLAVLSDGEIFSRYRVRRTPPVFVGGKPALTPADFRAGDYVVHLDYGVGRYLGIKRLQSGGEIREKMVIQYADKARLYVPLQQAQLVSRYLGLGSAPPALDRLGGSRWLKAKLEAQKAVAGLAGQLLEVQAHRATLAGHSFSPDITWQKEFEASFIYPETEDQLTALKEIKRDLESSRPMDRLLCGDVGYGKTEVAIRAAFKTVMDGKQVAVLVPTTVLAQQHLETFRERMADYPVKVEMLSRFLSPREQREVLGDLRRGAVDIVIGTHRLLQADVEFKDLGLVIIDEEQRFGVRHKERFKQMRKLVDVLTLTATPIPRTLYLSLTGARDLSMINTPPQDRLAVETRVGAYDPAGARRAIERETQRGGQVYYLFNRVRGIERVRDRLRAWFPGLRIEIAHAQMDEGELSGVMRRFSRGEVDVLVCTTIIESGLDIPNANTIIVERADRFGLADLYQLRGRVGRFKHRAYAYFFYPPFVFLEEGARRRLQAIEEFSHLGAGFSLAVRDLEIRGAGNILGREQHGHIAAVGFDLYCRLLERSIGKLKGGKERPALRAQIEFDSAGELPAEYVPGETLRVEMYRKWAAIAVSGDLESWTREMADRFGPLPPAARALVEEARLKLEADKKGITSIGRIDGKYVFRRGKEIVLVLDAPAGLRSPAEAYPWLTKRLKNRL